MTINTSRARATYVSVLAALALSACRSAPVAREVEMKVGRVMVDDAAHAPVVLLENDDQTLTLPIWIGVSEAQAIAMEMEGIQPPRPLTHASSRSTSRAPQKHRSSSRRTPKRPRPATGAACTWAAHRPAAT